MAVAVLKDRILETSTTTGTGTYTLAGAVTGYQAFSAAGDGALIYYSAFEVNASGVPSGGWEVGTGIYTLAGTTLTRASILSSSNAGAAVSWAAGTRRIVFTAPASVVPIPDSFDTTASDPIWTSLGVKGNASFKGPVPYCDVRAKGFTRLCSASIVTTTGSIANGSATLTLTSATGWSVGHGVWVVRTDNTIYRSYITVLVGTTATCNDVNSGISIVTGVTGHDDTLAIQDAIDFASSQGRVYIPGGSYYVWNLKLRGAVPVEGAGYGSTVLLSIPGNTSSAMVSLNATNLTNCQMRSLTLNGNKSATPAPTCGGIYFDNSGLTNRRHQLINVRITACAGNGITLTSVLRSHFTDVLIDTCNGYGVSEDAGSFFNHWVNIEINNAGLHGVYMLGLAGIWSNVFIDGAGQVNPASDCFYLGTDAHGHNVHSFWFSEGARSCLHIDASTGGQSVFVGSTHQNLAAEHVRITSGTACNLRMNAVQGSVRLATSLLNMVGGTRNNIEITYISGTNVLVADAQPAIGAGLSGGDNYTRVFDGSKLGTGDINMFDCEQLHVTQDWNRVAPSTLWRYPNSQLIHHPG